MAVRRRIDVETGRAGQARAHFLGEHAVAKPLRLAKFFIGTGPCNLQAMLRGDRFLGARKTPVRIERARNEGRVGRRQISHGAFLVER